MLKGPKRQVNSREAARSPLGLVIKPIAVPSHDEWIRKTISGFSPHSSSLSSRLGGFAPLRKKPTGKTTSCSLALSSRTAIFSFLGPDERLAPRWRRNRTWIGGPMSKGRPSR